jgi:hypothetical protein
VEKEITKGKACRGELANINLVDSGSWTRFKDFIEEKASSPFLKKGVKESWLTRCP